MRYWRGREIVRQARAIGNGICFFPLLSLIFLILGYFIQRSYYNITFRTIMIEQLEHPYLFGLLLIGLVIYARNFFKGLKQRKKPVPPPVDQSLSWVISYNANSPRNTRGQSLPLLLEHKLSQIEYLSLSTLPPPANLQIFPILMPLPLPQLRRLYLCDLYLQSIEPMSRLQLPLLQVLALSDNKIACIRGLRRLSCSNLIWLEIQNNPIAGGLECLSEMVLPSLNYMWVEFFGSDKLMGEDISWLVKCESVILTKFYLSSSKRILSNKVIDAMSRKFHNFDIRLKG